MSSPSSWISAGFSCTTLDTRSSNWRPRTWYSLLQPCQIFILPCRFHNSRLIGALWLLFSPTVQGWYWLFCVGGACFIVTTGSTVNLQIERIIETCQMWVHLDFSEFSHQSLFSHARPGISLRWQNRKSTWKRKNYHV